MIEERETELLLTALESGYVWSDAVASDAHPNIRKPLKGTRFDDVMNAGEYITIGEALSKPIDQEMWAADRRVAAMAQRVASAAIAAIQRPQALGPTGETLAEVERRLAQAARLHRDVDRSDARRGADGFSGRGGY